MDNDLEIGRKMRTRSLNYKIITSYGIRIFNNIREAD